MVYVKLPSPAYAGFHVLPTIEEYFRLLQHTLRRVSHSKEFKRCTEILLPSVFRAQHPSSLEVLWTHALLIATFTFCMVVSYPVIG